MCLIVINLSNKTTCVSLTQLLLYSIYVLYITMYLSIYIMLVLYVAEMFIFNGGSICENKTRP